MDKKNYMPRIIDHKIQEYLLSIQKAFEEDPKGKPPTVLCVLCGMSNAAYQRPDGVYVVPITALRN